MSLTNGLAQVISKKPDFRLSYKYEPLFKNTHYRYNLVYGGRGSGKSYCIALLFLIKLISPEFFRGIIMREVLGDIRHSQFREITDLIDDFELNHLFKIQKQTMEITCITTGNTVFAKGFKKSSGNQTAKVKSIKDPTAIWIEEADEVTLEDFTKADTSLRTTKAKDINIYLSFNPENPESWIRKKWFDDNLEPKKDTDTQIIHSTYKNNIRNLKRSYIRILKGMLENDHDLAQVYLYGKWGSGLKGRIYTKFDIITLDDYNRIPSDYITYGIDWGYNDPMVLMECKFYDGIPYFKTLYYETGKQVEDLIRFMDKNYIDTRIPIYCDTNRADSRRKLRNAGYNTQAAKKDVIEGIDTLKSFRFCIIDGDVVQKKEIGNYKWDRDERENKDLDRPVKSNDHGLDCMRYIAHSDPIIRTYNIYERY